MSFSFGFVAIGIGAVILVVIALVVVSQLVRARDEAAQRPREAVGGSGDPEVDRLVSEGQPIAAIARVRQLTNWGLKEAKDYVDAMPNVPPLQQAARMDTPVQAVFDDAETRALVARGAVIEAIKRVRELTGLGLREAKEIVDRMPRGQA